MKKKSGPKLHNTLIWHPVKRFVDKCTSISVSLQSILFVLILEPIKTVFNFELLHFSQQNCENSNIKECFLDFFLIHPVDL